MEGLLISIIIFLIPNFIQETIANPRLDIVSRNCSDIAVRNGLNYLVNFWKANEQVYNEIKHAKYGFGAAGDPPQRIYVFAQCQGDLSHDDCNLCYTTARNLIPGCFPLVGGRVYLDGCFIRAANYSFYHETDPTIDLLLCGATMEEKKSDFRNVVEKVVNNLVKKAPVNNGFGVGYGKSGGGSVYGLANCWKTLDEESCKTCLESTGSSVLKCKPATEGRAIKAGCIIRYSDYDFINDLMSQTLERTFFSFITYVIGVTAVSVLAIVIGVFVGKMFYNHKSRQRWKLKVMETDASLFKRSLRFKHSTLEKATDHFCESHKLGQGGFGEVFKGNLPDGREIVVKRLFVNSNQGEEIYNEANVISRMEHKNLVHFLGCCLTSHDSLLVYEFLANKSLDLILFDPEKKKELDWKKRVGIIIGTAQGLEYLHKDCEVVIIHRDIKASNVLLDFKHRPKIADFGLARFYSSDTTPFKTPLAGTLGYMAPEYISQGLLTEKVDVYSYGVLVLEIVSGVQNNKFKNDESLDTLVTSTWKHFQSNSVLEIIDESMKVDDIEKEVMRVVQVGLLCTQEAPSLRPTMTEVIQMLTQKDVYLTQPSKPPFVDDSMEFSNCSGEQCNSWNPHNSDNDPTS